MKGFFILALLCVLSFGGWKVWQNHNDKADAAKRTQIVTIARGNIEELVTAQGKLEPKEFVDVGVQVSGQIKKIYVELGQVVKKGELIAEIDPKIYEAKVEADEARIKTLEAQIAQQEAQLILAQQQFDRNDKLLKTHAVSQDAFDNSNAALKVAKAQKMALEAQLQEARSTLDGDRANLDFTRIFAPMTGTVVIADAKEGQTLNATQSAPRIVQLANLDTMTVRAQVAEADIMRIREEGSVYFTTLGAQGRKWQGSVRQILPSPQVINEVVLYDVLIDVDNRDRKLMSGMSTQMFFVMGRAENALFVPVAALGKRAPKEDGEKGIAYRVRVMEGGKQAERIIHVGLMDRTVAEVKSGLAEGDKVVVEGAAAEGDDTRSTRRFGRKMGARL